MYLKNKPKTQRKYVSKKKTFETEEEQAENQLKRAKESNARNEKLDEMFGFAKYESGPAKIGWLANFRTTSILDEDERSLSAIDYYFIEEDGSTFKCTITNEPYFYIGVKRGMEQQVEQFLIKQYTTKISRTLLMEKEDLEMVCEDNKKNLHYAHIANSSSVLFFTQLNHLSGLKAKFIRVSFPNVQDLLHVRKFILDLVEKNSKKTQIEAYEYEDFHESHLSSDEEDVDMDKDSNMTKLSNALSGGSSHMALLDSIIDIREYDVSYHIRTAIDQGMLLLTNIVF